MQFKEVNPNNLPEFEVLAYNGIDTPRIGWLETRDIRDIVYCYGAGNTIENVTHYIPLDEIMPSDGVLLPRKLTAENGAKALLSGEFLEFREVPNPSHCDCGECDFCEDFPDTPEVITQEIIISWDNIKAIYSKIVSHFAP